MSALLFGPWLVCLLGQSGVARPVFDVVSIKPSQMLTREPMRISAQRFEATIPVRGLIRMAYRVQDFQIKGAPSWADSQTYDVVAVTEKPFTMEEAQVMVQGLLAERFRLVVHHETREVSQYMLSVLNGGSRLLAASNNSDGRAADLQVFRNPETGTVELSAIKTPMERFAAAMSAMLGVPVRDNTELDGLYDFKLKWHIDEVPSVGGAASGADRSTAENPLAPPPLLTAIREQLGLKLETVKSTGDILVIDHVEKPTLN